MGINLVSPLTGGPFTLQLHPQGFLSSWQVIAADELARRSSHQAPHPLSQSDKMHGAQLKSPATNEVLKMTELFPSAKVDTFTAAGTSRGGIQRLLNDHFRPYTLHLVGIGKVKRQGAGYQIYQGG